MIEDNKKILYIPRVLRLGVSAALVASIMATGFLGYTAATIETYAALLQPAVELMKLLLTGTAAWGLVVLYASANSAERIAKETDRFFKEDVLRVFKQKSFSHAAVGKGREVLLLGCQSGTAVYKVSSDRDAWVYLWCNLNVDSLTIVFLLDPAFVDTYPSVFRASMKGFASRSISVESFGVQTHDADGFLPCKESYLELFISRQLPSDFVFDAAARCAAAYSIFGDARSLLTEAVREANRKKV